MYLLDTCTLLWLAADHAALSPTAKAVVLSRDTTLYFSHKLAIVTDDQVIPTYPQVNVVW